MSGIPAGAGSLLNKRLGKFEILALLALGGTAEIYLARIGGAAGFEKYVVVKCLHDHLNDDQDFVKMFLDEARLAAHLDHSNIVQTMELGEHEGRYYMVMEFLAGLSMAMIIRRVTERLPGGVLPVPLSLNMLAQSCAGLHYAHERAVSGKSLGIVHRDISPQNLVVSFEGVVKVVDFGIAKAEQRETKTRSGTIKGKFAYMSPEQCVANNVDRRTDVFALGIIAHELLTGRRLFKRTSPYETYQAVIDCNVPKPSSQNVELDPAIDALVMTALAKDKEKRYPTAEAFGDAILGYLHNRGKGSGPGDVARFFDQHFNQEIEEHGARMRELIEGRDISLSSGVTWGADDDKKGVETVDLKGNETQDLSVADFERPSSGSLSDVLSNMGQTGDASIDEGWGDDADDDEGDGPAERTRIEANPLELLAELKATPPSAAAATAPKKPASPPPQQPRPMPAPVAKTPIPSIAGAPKKQPAPQPQPQPQPPRDPAMRPPQQAKMPPSGPLPLPPTPPPGSSGVMPKQGGKFPELANLPTMVADLDESSVSGVANPQQDPKLANAKTALAAPITPDDPRAGGMPMVPRAKASEHTVEAGQPFLDQLPQPPRPLQGPAQQRTLFDPGNGGSPPPQGSGPQQAPYGFDPQTGQPQQQPYNNGYPPHQQMPMPNGYPQNGYPPPQQPWQPQSNQTGPMPMPQPQPQIDSGVYMQAPNPNLMSPVGPQYPKAGLDWEAAANAPVRKLPTWLLVTLFVVAIGIALGLTIAIARLARG